MRLNLSVGGRLSLLLRCGLATRFSLPRLLLSLRLASGFLCGATMIALGEGLLASGAGRWSLLLG
jgi:hypothetical protein